MKYQQSLNLEYTECQYLTTSECHPKLTVLINFPTDHKPVTYLLTYYYLFMYILKQ